MTLGLSITMKQTANQKIESSEGIRNGDLEDADQIAVENQAGNSFMAAGLHNLQAGKVYVFKKLEMAIGQSWPN